MEARERPTFDSETAERIYRYVERHRTVKRHKLLDQVSASPEEFGEELDRLLARGYLTDDGGTIRLALNVGTVEEYETDDLTVSIRPGRQSDFEELVDAIRDVTAEETYVVAESVAEELLYEDTVTRHNPVESRVFFVATVGDDLVGWTHLDLPQIEPLEGTAQQTVGVREEYRGLGIGSQLLQRGLDWAEANGLRKVYNTLPMTNDTAVRFLEAHGWNTEAIRRDHYTIDGEHVDELVMSYEF